MLTTWRSFVLFAFSLLRLPSLRLLATSHTLCVPTPSTCHVTCSTKGTKMLSASLPTSLMIKIIQRTAVLVRFKSTKLVQSVTKPAPGQSSGEERHSFHQVVRLYDRCLHKPDQSEHLWAEPCGQSLVYTRSGRLYDANGSLGARADLACSLVGITF